MRFQTIVAALLAVVVSAQNVWADPFSDLTKSGRDACFRRSYDAAHLRKNPRQQTTSLVVWITGDTDQSGTNVGLAAVRRGDPQALFISAACEWEVYKGERRSWMELYKKKAGAGCVTLAVPDVFDSSSAEEGGGVLLDPAADGKTLMVYLDEYQTMVKRADRGRKISIMFGADDRIFLLRRIDAKECNFVKEALTAPEPGARGTISAPGQNR